MHKLLIEPNVGIGKVKLGMTREEVHRVMGNNYFSFTRNAVNIDAYYSSCFQINYDKNYVVEFIEMANGIAGHFQVVFEEVDVFKTKAEALVAYVEKFAGYDKDSAESKSGYSYIFKDIGLSLWRPRVFKEEFLQESWFQELKQEIKEDEMKYWYFEAVGLGRKGYWDTAAHPEPALKDANKSPAFVSNNACNYPSNDTGTISKEELYQKLAVKYGLEKPK